MTRDVSRLRNCYLRKPRMKLGFACFPIKLGQMETAAVTVEGDHQTVRLPKSVHLPPTVFVRQDGDSVVLEPAKPKSWPVGFFDSIHVADPAFERPEQGQLPPVKGL